MLENICKVCIFGVDAPPIPGGCCCGEDCCAEPAKNMLEEYEDLAVTLKEVFGDRVECKFIDVRTSAIKTYPEVVRKLDRSRLPLTFINGKLRSYGGLEEDLTIEAVQEQLDKAK